MTKKQFELNILVIKKSKEFFAICINLNIAETGATFEEAVKKVIKLCTLHIETVYKKNLDSSLLNRPADKKYLDLWNKAKINSLVKFGQQKGKLKAKETQEIEFLIPSGRKAHESKKLALQRN